MVRVLSNWPGFMLRGGRTMHRLGERGHWRRLWRSLEDQRETWCNYQSPVGLGITYSSLYNDNSVGLWWMHGQKVGIWTKSVVFLLVLVKMGKLRKPRKVMMVLVDLHSGCKADIVTVAGIDHCFYRMTVATTELIAKRPKTKPSVKVCHYNLLMPTRSSVDIPFNKTVINKVVFRDSALKSKVSWEPRSSLKSNLSGWEQMALSEALALGVFLPSLKRRKRKKEKKNQ